MRSLLKKMFFIIFLFSIFSTHISAIDCEYPDAGLTISYGQDDVVTVDYEKFTASGYYTNLLGVVKWGSDLFTTEDLEISQELFEIYQGYSCPSKMYVCEYYGFEINSPSVKSLFHTLNQATFLDYLLDEETRNSNSEDSWALITPQDKKLYIYTYEDYENSDLPGYIGGRASTSWYDEGENAYNFCTANGDLKGLGWTLLGSGCATFWGFGKGVVWDGFTRDGGIELFYYKEAKCNTIKYDGEYAAFDVNCSMVAQKLFEYKQGIENYLDCDGVGCKKMESSELIEIEDSLKNQCKSILSNFDFNAVQSDCILDCINMKDILNELREGTDLYEEKTFGYNCMFDETVLSFVYNILKWMKYLVPALVIFLSMVDFIKAIGSNDSDTMKKAQDRFIKRLIVAIIFFLAPLLINFMLKTYGLYNEACDISLLFG